MVITWFWNQWTVISFIVYYGWFVNEDFIQTVKEYTLNKIWKLNYKNITGKCAVYIWPKMCEIKLPKYVQYLTNMRIASNCVGRHRLWSRQWLAVELIAVEPRSSETHLTRISFNRCRFPWIFLFGNSIISLQDLLRRAMPTCRYLISFLWNSVEQFLKQIAS